MLRRRRPRPQAPFRPGRGESQDARGVIVKALIYPGEDGYMVAECPALPGCASQGRMREVAMASIREAVEGWLEVQEERGGAILATEGIEIVEVTV